MAVSKPAKEVCMKIRIRTRKGKEIIRNAYVKDMLSADGKVYSLAQVGVFLYRIVERRPDGNVWSVV
jgi:hypothetical protein